MIPNVKERQVITGGAVDSVQFGIDQNDFAHVINILRDTLYSDKILAVLREYSANAWDAHRMSGKGEVPISVTIPTDVEPNLKIRDFGPGLSQNDVFTVFTQYGKSTKRTSNDAVGMLGIGSKSGFAYSESFTITSWHGGVKSIYTAAIDASDLGVLTLLFQEPCDASETGIEVQIGIQRRDIYEFQNKARELFKYFSPRPSINIELPRPVEDKEKLKNGIIRTDTTAWVAVMGCVPYRVDMGQIRGVAGFDCETIDRFGGVLYFNIGDVQVNASREELKYSDKTKAAIVAKFNDLVDEYVTHTIKSIENGNGTQWEKRIRAQSLNTLGLAPDGEMFEKWVKLTPEILATLEHIKIYRGSELAHTITIRENVRIVFQDDFKRTLNGFQLGEYDYLVKPVAKSDNAEARAELADLFATLEIVGIKEVNLSTVDWYAKRQNSFKQPNIKHRVKNFKLIPSTTYYKPYSNNWETETERDAEPSDVFVYLCAFKCTSYDFYNLYLEDSKLAKAFGHTMPVVYGYKWSVNPGTKFVAAQGMEYAEWSKAFRKSLLQKEVIEALELRERAKPVTYRWYGGYSSYDITSQSIKPIAASLGDAHPITKYIADAFAAHTELRKRGFNEDVLYTIDRIATANNVTVSKDTEKALKAVLNGFYGKYSLLTIDNGNMLRILGHDAQKWFEYIKMVDKI